MVATAQYCLLLIGCSGRSAACLDAPVVAPQLEAPPRLPASRRHQRSHHDEAGEHGQAPQHRDKRCSTKTRRCLETERLNGILLYNMPQQQHPGCPLTLAVEFFCILAHQTSQNVTAARGVTWSSATDAANPDGRPAGGASLQGGVHVEAGQRHRGAAGHPAAQCLSCWPCNDFNCKAFYGNMLGCKKQAAWSSMTSIIGHAQ